MSGTQGGNQQDIAGLGFAVDSSQVVTATSNLDQLKASSDKLAESQDNLTTRVQRFLAVANDMGESTAQMRRQFQDASQSLDGLIQTLDTARSRMDGTAASFANLAAAQGQVQALGQSFGVTSAGIEAFTQQSQVLGLSAAQTTLALQRITEAMNNQTLAGQQVRQQIQGLGIDLANLNANDSAGVLATVVQKLRTTQDGVGKYQTESGILGITDPGTLYQLNQQPIMTTAQRRDMQRQQEASRQIADTTQFVSGNQRQMSIDDASYDDLNGQYNLDRSLLARQSNVFSGLSAAQAAQLASAVGLPTTTNFVNQDERLTALKYLDANPDSDLANAARRPIAQGERDYDQSYLGGAVRHLTDGTFGSNELDIQDAYDEASRRNSGFLGLNIGNFVSAQGSEIANIFNGYTPRKPVTDSRDVDGDTAIRTDQQAGTTLQGFGDDSLSNYQSIAAQMRRLQDPSVLGTYTKNYGTAEGQARYYGTLSGLKNDQATSLITGGDQIQDLQQQQYLLGTPLSQRPEAEQLLKFMSGLSDQKGNIPALWSGSSPMSLDDVINANGTSGGPGVLTPQESAAFLKIQQLTKSNAQTSADQAFGVRMDDAGNVTAASAISPATVQDTTTAIQAYNAAVRDGLDPVKAQAQAEAELTEKRKAAGAALLAQIDFSSKQAGVTLASTAGAPLDQVSQGSSRYTTGISNDFEREVNSGSITDTPAQRAAYTASRQAGLGIQSKQFGQDEIASATQSLSDAASTGIGGMGAAAERAEATFKTFADALAKAQASGDGASNSLKSVTAAMDEVIRIGERATQLRFDGQAWSTAQGNNLDAASNRYIAAAPASQRTLLGTQLQTAMGLYQSGDPAMMGGSNRPALDGSSVAMITQLAQSLGVSPSLAMMIAQQEGGGTNQANMFQVQPGTLPQAMQYLRSQNGPNVATPDINTRQGSAMAGIGYLGYLQGLPGFGGNYPAIAAGYNAGPNNAGVQAFIASGDTNIGALPKGVNAQGQYDTQAYVAPFMPTPQDLLTRAAADPATNAQLASEANQQDGSTKRDIANAQSAAQPLESIEQLLEKLLGSGDTGKAALLRAGVNENPLNPTLGATQAGIRVLQTNEGFAQQSASNNASTTQDIADNTKLGAAYATSADAVLRANAAIQANKEAQALNLTATQQSIREAQLYNDALSKQAVAFGQLTKANRDQTELASQAANLPIMPADQRAQILAQSQAYQSIDNQFAPGSSDNEQAKAQYNLLQTTKQAAAGAQAANDAFADMGKTIFNTFEQAGTSGQRFKVIMGEMLISIGQIIEKLLIEKPLENAISNGFGSLFGSSVNGAANGATGGIFGNIFGGIFTSSGTTATNFAASAGPEVGGLYATGGVFGPAGPIKMHATGSVVNSPTGFADAGGGRNIMGEAGPEAIMPLTVLPNGSLGIAAGSGGGGGAQTVIVHTPITIQSAGGGGVPDPQTAALIQRTIEMAGKKAIKAALLREQKPGGSLYGTGQY